LVRHGCLKQKTAKANRNADHNLELPYSWTNSMQQILKEFVVAHYDNLGHKNRPLRLQWTINYGFHAAAIEYTISRLQGITPNL
jgi:hypothetical protein